MQRFGAGERVDQLVRLKHRDFYEIRPDILDAFDEFEALIVP